MGACCGGSKPQNQPQCCQPIPQAGGGQPQQQPQQQQLIAIPQQGAGGQQQPQMIAIPQQGAGGPPQAPQQPQFIALQPPQQQGGGGGGCPPPPCPPPGPQIAPFAFQVQLQPRPAC
jgi:hypothetical protein